MSSKPSMLVGAFRTGPSAPPMFRLMSAASTVEVVMGEKGSDVALVSMSQSQQPK